MAGSAALRLTADELHQVAVAEVERQFFEGAEPDEEPMESVNRLALRVCNVLSDEYPGRYVSHYEVASEVRERVRRSARDGQIQTGG